MAKGQRDQFPQYASLTVSESAANTLTFAQLQTGGILFDRRAFVIHRIEYNFDAATNIAASADSVIMGLAVSNQLAAISQADPNVIDFMQLRRVDFGTAASGQLYTTPWVRDFTDLPGKGIILPSHPLFGYVQGVSSPAAVTLGIKFYYTIMELSAEDFIELVEAMRVIT